MKTNNKNKHNTLIPEQHESLTPTQYGFTIGKVHCVYARKNARKIIKVSKEEEFCHDSE